jgi:hypothetical protein
MNKITTFIKKYKSWGYGAVTAASVIWATSQTFGNSKASIDTRFANVNVRVDNLDAKIDITKNEINARMNINDDKDRNEHKTFQETVTKVAALEQSLIDIKKELEGIHSDVRVLIGRKEMAINTSN